MKLIRESINDNFDLKSTSMKNLGIQNEKTLITEKINAVALKYGFKKWPVKIYGHISIGEAPHFKIIKSWFNPNIHNGTWVHLMYDHHNRHDYFIEIENEQGESGVEKIRYPDHPVFKEKWWKLLSNR